GARRSANIHRFEGASYHIEVKYYEKMGNASGRLLWSRSVQQALEPVPSDAFYYTPDIAPPNPPLTMTRPRGPAAARGLLLADGTFLPGAARAVDDRRVSFVSHDRAEPTDVPLASVAQVIFHPLRRAAATNILTRTAGVL